MKLHASFAIVILIVGQSFATVHQIGSFASREICEKEIAPAVQSLGLDNGGPTVVGEPVEDKTEPTVFSIINVGCVRKT